MFPNTGSGHLYIVAVQLCFIEYYPTVTAGFTICRALPVCDCVSVSGYKGSYKVWQDCESTSESSCKSRGSVQDQELETPLNNREYG